MSFKVFDAYGAASRPTATLRASGYLFLSKSIQKRAGRDNPTHAELSFDEETDRAAIRLLMDLIDDTDAPSVREVSTEKSGISVNLLPLLRYYQFDKPTKKHILAVDFDDEQIVIDLTGLRADRKEEERTE